MRRTLEERGLLRREPDPTDGRAALAVLTKRGLEALRRAQVVHHAAVRELYLDRLTPNDLNRLARLFDGGSTAMIERSGVSVVQVAITSWSRNVSTVG